MSESRNTVLADSQTPPNEPKCLDEFPRFAERQLGLPSLYLNKRPDGYGPSETTDAKHMLRYYLRMRRHDMKLTRIARMIGWCDHTTVLSSIRRHRMLYDSDRRYRERYDAFEAACLLEGYHRP